MVFPYSPGDWHRLRKGSGRLVARREWGSPVVAAGYGIVAPDQQRDDYAGVDVKDKVALVRRFVPTAEIEAAIRFWCDRNNYSKGNREDWIKGVIDSAYDFVGEHLRDRRSGNIDLRFSSTPELIRRATSRAIASRKARRSP